MSDPDQITRANAQAAAAESSEQDLRDWRPCGADGCTYCCEFERARDVRWGVDKIPRRSRLDKLTPAEKAIRAVIDMVEQVGADPLLTESVILLGKAADKLADYVDREAGK